jgi:hypothetical protein
MRTHPLPPPRTRKRRRHTRPALNSHQTPFEWDTPIGKTKFNNLVYTFDPDAPRKVVIAAHFDSKYFPSFPANQVSGCYSPPGASPLASPTPSPSPWLYLPQRLMRHWRASARHRTWRDAIQWKTPPRPDASFPLRTPSPLYPLYPP